MTLGVLEGLFMRGFFCFIILTPPWFLLPYSQPWLRKCCTSHVTLSLNWGCVSPWRYVTNVESTVGMSRVRFQHTAPAAGGLVWRETGRFWPATPLTSERAGFSAETHFRLLRSYLPAYPALPSRSGTVHCCLLYPNASLHQVSGNQPHQL